MLRLVENSNVNTFFGKPVFADDIFFGLGLPAANSLNILRKPVFFPKGSKIAVRGEFPNDVIVFGEGEAALFLNSIDYGKRRIRKILRNEILGLPETLADFSYVTEVEAVTDCVCDAISKNELIRVLSLDSSISFRLLEILGRNLQTSYRQFESH